MSSTKPAAPRTDTATTDEVAGYGSAEAMEQGYVGTVPDETPNENYTFAGQAAGAETPETAKAAQPKAADKPAGA